MDAIGPYSREIIIAVLVMFIGYVAKRLTAIACVKRKVGDYTVAAFVVAAEQGDRALDLIRCFLRGGIHPDLWDGTGRTALIAAAGAGQIATVRLLVSRRWRIGRRRSDPNRTGRDGIPPVRVAVTKRHRDIYDVLVGAEALTNADLRAEVLRQAVEFGDDVELGRRIPVLQSNEIDLAGDDGRNALLIAVERARIAIVRLLLDANADPNVRHEDKTPLLIAARRNLGAIAEELLRTPRLDVDAATALGETALMIAAEGGYLGVVQALLERNANAATADRRGRTALMAAILGGYDAIAALLRQRTGAGEAEAWLIRAADEGDEHKVRDRLAAGANPNVQAAGGRSALLDAARHGHTGSARLLIETKRVNLDLADDHGDTALILAARAGARALVAMLLAAGANPNVRRDADGSYALIEAVLTGRVTVVDVILKATPTPKEVNAPRRDGYTPLMAAVEAGERTIADRLLAAGADPNVETESGLSPLLIAVERGDRPMQELLRRRGAVVGDREGQLLVEARRGNLQHVQQLLDLGVSVNLLGPRGATPLLEAVRGGHLKVAEELIERGADFNHAGGGNTALTLAVRGGHLGVVALLIAKNARLDAPAPGNGSPLLIACERHNFDIAHALLDAGADPNAADDLGRTPLLLALVTGRGDIEKELRDRGATRGELEAQLILAARGDNLPGVTAILAQHPNVDTPGLAGETALLAASAHAGAAVLDALLAAGADVNVKTTSGKTPLTTAAARGDLAVLDTLLAAGAAADLTGPDERTALMIAAANGSLQIVQHLLLAKNNPNETDRAGLTALMLAARGGHTLVVLELIAAAAKVDAGSPAGRTALMFAAEGGHVATIDTLVAHGADVNAADEGGSTALILACFEGKLGAVTALLDHGADVNARDTIGQTPLMLGILAGDRLLETALRDHGAVDGEKEAELIDGARTGNVGRVRMLLAGAVDINARRRGGDTALIAATEAGHSPIAHMLLAKEADVNIKGRGGRTALIAAAAHDDLALVRAIAGRGAKATCEAMDQNGASAVLISRDPNIRLHLRETCDALQPDDEVYVTENGNCYHRPACGYLGDGGSRSSLNAAADRHLRPCSTCITNQ